MKIRSTEYNSPGSSSFEVGLHCPHYPYHSEGTPPSRKSINNQQKSGLKIYHLPVSPIRKLPQASYPSKGRQNGDHNYRKLTKLITWITAMSNSMKLWAMPCRATQDRQVMVESFDKTWSTGDGNGKPVQYSCLENPMNSMNCGTGEDSREPLGLQGDQTS